MARMHVPAVIGFYDDPKDTLLVAEKARTEMHFKNLDVYTPYAVHGMDEALGLKRSWVSTAARYVLVLGWFAGFMFQSWTASVDWPVNIGGKPYVSWPAWIPITFEFGILMASFTNLICMLAVCGLFPKPKTIILSKRITNDRFVILIPFKDQAEEQRAISFLREYGALKIKVVEGIDKKRQQVIFRSTPLSESVA
ncbi:DUF3341 domain-containing protein [soil metagenome]